MNESNAERKKRLIMEGMNWLDRQTEAWKNEDNRILSDDNIDLLRTIASKNFTNRENKQNLTPNERAVKTDIHQKLRNGFSDIVRMIHFGMMGSSSMWNPNRYDDKVDRLPYDVDTWKEDFKAYDVGEFVECLVSMYGDEYAIPLADAIRRGLEAKDGWDSRYEVDVPIIRRNRRVSP